MPRRNPKDPPFASEDLEPVEFLERGAWGFVWRYRQFSRATGTMRHARTVLGYVAVKCVEVSEYTRQTVQQVFSEARNQRRGAGNGHVVALHDVIVLSDDLIALVMEEVPGGRTLANEIDEAYANGAPFSAEVIAQWAKEIALGLQAFHAPAGKDKRRIAHRDIAPENVLLTPDGVVKLADMGIATVVMESGLGPSDPAPAQGRIVRMAPEQYYGDGDWGIAVDYWALGLIVFELATRTPLERFCGERVPSMTASPEYSRAIGEAVRRAARQHPSMHPDLRELIVDLLGADPRERGGLERVERAYSRIVADASRHRGPRYDGIERHDGDRRTPPPMAARDRHGSWMSVDELNELRTELDAAQQPGQPREGAFERLVGQRRAERHRSEQDEA